MLKRALVEDTIVAPATPPGEGGIGVIRISGERAIAVADAIFRCKNGRPVSSQKTFTVRYGQALGRGGKTADEALLLLMRAPKSYTGQDTVEISVHGGSAVVNAVVEGALEAGARLAEPGEFTKRAFLNGRLDLLQAEAVLDLVHAKTEKERSWALSQLEGSLSKKMSRWKEELVDILSHFEASIDFPDDEPDTQSALGAAARLEDLASALEAALRDSELVFLAKRGFRVALWGRPNVGKSSLLNRLTRSDRVIVTPYPGTTRDVVEEQGSIGGFPVRFQDTAGIRATEHPIEKEGVERSRKAMASADLVLLVLDASQPLEKEDENLFRDLKGRAALVLLNKRDLPRKLGEDVLRKALPQAWPVVMTSCLEEEGLREAEKAILGCITRGRAEIPEEAQVSTARQRDLLEKVSKDISRAALSCREGLPAELAASDLRQALAYLGELVGEVVNDDILDNLFNQFCIGK